MPSNIKILNCRTVLIEYKKERKKVTENDKERPLLTVEYKRKGSFLGWFVGLVMPIQEIFVLPWLIKPTQYEKYFFPTNQSACG
jgi:hypothetical protein